MVCIALLLLSGCAPATKTGEYNLTRVMGANSTAYMVKNANDELMFGWMGSMWILVIFMIVLIAVIQRTKDTPVAFGTASFISWGLSLFLMALEMVPDEVMFVTLIMSAFSVVMIKGTERP